MSPPEGDEKKELSDAELLAWARKRGVVTFFFFFSIAAAVAAWWYLTR
ncbi:MAG: hypothetical protein KIT84_06115 [Labilithrix sp.]|nr:hypothetical protein [Labilithrix sp.]MCW5810566.1 hypothetical protein [Labilithrix sp.]